MQGTLNGCKGMVLVLQGGRHGIAKCEDGHGDTSTIERNGQTWKVTRDVWDEEAQDWRGEPINQHWPDFAKDHGITAIVS